MDDALRRRLEGSVETLERVDKGCRALLRVFRTGWRPRTDPTRLSGFIADVEALPRVLKRIGAVRERPRKLDRLVANVNERVAALDERADKLLSACDAELEGSLDRKLRGLVELCRGDVLEGGEQELWSGGAELYRDVKVKLWESPGGVPSDGSDTTDTGVLRMTQHRFLYADASRSLRAPHSNITGARNLVSIGGWAGSVSHAEPLVLRWWLWRAFGEARKMRPLEYAVFPVRRVRDRQMGFLLVSRAVVLFAPRMQGILLVRALGLEREGDYLLVLPEVDLVLDAVGSLLPWVADGVLDTLRRSSWNSAWRGADLITTSDGKTLHLSHRSGSEDQPVYEAHARFTLKVPYGTASALHG
jgi:hypothetical protein